MIFAQWMRLLYQAQKHTWKISYTLEGMGGEGGGGSKAHGKQNESIISFVHLCISKLWLVVEDW